MVKLKCFDDWREYEGASEGNGRSEKIWLCKSDNDIGLFKFPKTVSKEDLTPNSTEFVSEHLAYLIARQIGIPCARIEIGYRDGRIGCMSHSFRKPHQVLLHGVDFITLEYPNFNVDRLYDEDSGEYYSYEMIHKSMEKVFGVNQDNMRYIECYLIWMMIFDMLIGNTDRHQQNWGMIFDKQKENFSMAPLYDNGSSLCAYVSEKDTEKFLGNDKMKFESLVNGKSTSRIRIENRVKKEPKHSAVIAFLNEKYHGQCKLVVDKITNSITQKWVMAALEGYPRDILSIQKRELIFTFLQRKIELLREIIG